MVGAIRECRSQMTLTQMGIIIGRIVDLHRSIFSGDMDKLVDDLADTLRIDEDEMAKYVCQLVKAFGTEIPTINDYPDFSFLDKKLYVPSAKMVKKNPDMQQCWTEACQWAKAYARKQTATVIGAKDYRIKELQEEINKLDEIIEKQKEIIKLNQEFEK